MEKVEKEQETAVAVLASGRRSRIESKRCWTFSRSVRFGADPAREGIPNAEGGYGDVIGVGASTTQQPAKSGLEGEKNQVRGVAEAVLGSQKQVKHVHRWTKVT